MDQPRKGARSRADISPALMAALNSGREQTASLSEWLAIDQLALLQQVLGERGLDKATPRIAEQARQLPRLSVNTLSQLIGAQLEALERGGKAPQLFASLAQHPADRVRGWACYMVRARGLRLSGTLKAIRPLAADPHFSVREVAWMAVRPHLAAELEQALALLQPWVRSPDANIRRFAVEATRPRGVWCEHIPRLKEEPALGQPLLENLREEPERYVQNSVANWLNDAAKTQPDFVRQLCARWLEQSDSPATRYIARRAQRSF